MGEALARDELCHIVRADREAAVAWSRLFVGMYNAPTAIATVSFSRTPARSIDPRKCPH
jgi:hypothetical protein